jgi:hypothetical protein
MEEKKEDQVANELQMEQSKSEQSGEASEPKISLEEVAAIARGTQKGYTQQQEQLIQINETLQSIVDQMNAKSGANSGDEEYVTVGKLKEILNQQTYEAEERKVKADAYIDKTLTQLRAEGKITNKEDEDALLNFALKHQQPDLLKAAELFDEVRQAKEEARKEAAKSKAKQEEGSKVGTSSKATTGEQGGVDYEKMKKMDWFSF